MKHIIVGTNRPKSRTLQVALSVQKIFSEIGEPCQMIRLDQVAIDQVNGTQYGDGVRPPELVKAIGEVDSSDGLIFVVPEYNGSFPGVLKYFIDHWSYPRSFEFRPMAFVGLGFKWGGLRPVEQLQQVMGYRNAYMYPERVFVQNIGEALTEQGGLTQFYHDLLLLQAKGFCKFIKALKSQGLDANSILQAKIK